MHRTVRSSFMATSSFPDQSRAFDQGHATRIHIETQPPAKHDDLDRKQMATVALAAHCFLRSSGTPTGLHRQSRAPGAQWGLTNEQAPTRS